MVKSGLLSRANTGKTDHAYKQGIEQVNCKLKWDFAMWDYHLCAKKNEIEY